MDETAKEIVDLKLFHPPMQVLSEKGKLKLKNYFNQKLNEMVEDINSVLTSSSLGLDLDNVEFQLSNNGDSTNHPAGRIKKLDDLAIWCVEDLNKYYTLAGLWAIVPFTPEFAGKYWQADITSARNFFKQKHDSAVDAISLEDDTTGEYWRNVVIETNTPYRISFNICVQVELDETDINI